MQPWKQQLKLRTGWSDEVVNAIRSEEEALVYEKARLVEAKVGGKTALVQPHIDADYQMPEWWIKKHGEGWRGWSNADLMGEGYPAHDANGDPYELHHIGQDPFSPLAELTADQHRSDGNFAVLHSFNESKIDREYFDKEVKRNYWMARYKMLK